MLHIHANRLLFYSYLVLHYVVIYSASDRDSRLIKTMSRVLMDYNTIVAGFEVIASSDWMNIYIYYYIIPQRKCHFLVTVHLKNSRCITFTHSLIPRRVIIFTKDDVLAYWTAENPRLLRWVRQSPVDQNLAFLLLEFTKDQIQQRTLDLEMVIILTKEAQ